MYIEIKFLMQFYAPRNIHFPYVITYLDSLLEGLQEFPTLKQTISLEIGLKCIISDYNLDHTTHELRTWITNRFLVFDTYYT